MTTIPDVPLNNGVPMPQLGFGVFQIPDSEVTDAVLTAFDAGYRSIDTAAGYRNEAGVGRAVRASGLRREDVFVTTKLANWDQGYDEALKAFDASLAELGMDYVDLYLIHWPMPARDAYVDTWRAFETILADGRARSIGVSNFRVADLDRLAAETDVVPAINQIELHPLLQQRELRARHAAAGIATEAWSPLAKARILDDPVIRGVADEHGRTPAQVVLRWHLQFGNVVIPKSATPERIRENIDVFGFELSDDDMAAIAPLDVGMRTGPDPDTFSA